MKTYTIERRVTRYETIEVEAKDRREAIKTAENAEDRFWRDSSTENEIQLISIS